MSHSSHASFPYHRQVWEKHEQLNDQTHLNYKCHWQQNSVPLKFQTMLLHFMTQICRSSEKSLWVFSNPRTRNASSVPSATSLQQLFYSHLSPLPYSFHFLCIGLPSMWDNNVTLHPLWSSQPFEVPSTEVKIFLKTFLAVYSKLTSSLPFKLHLTAQGSSWNSKITYYCPCFHSVNASTATESTLWLMLLTWVVTFLQCSTFMLNVLQTHSASWVRSSWRGSFLM